MVHWPSYLYIYPTWTDILAYYTDRITDVTNASRWQVGSTSCRCNWLLPTANPSNALKCRAPVRSGVCRTPALSSISLRSFSSRVLRHCSQRSTSNFTPCSVRALVVRRGNAMLQQQPVQTQHSLSFDIQPYVCIRIRWIGLDSMQALNLIIRERRTTGALLVKATRYASMRAVCSLAVGAGMASVSSPLNSSSKKPSSIASPFWPAACTSVLNADKSSRTAFRALLRSSDLQVIADFTLRLLFCLHLKA
jgi:hypothetical protein